MLPHPATWDAAVAQGTMRPTVKATAYVPGAFASGIDVPVSDGYVLRDASQYPRTHAQVTCADTSVVPTTLSSKLTPWGNYLRIEYGLTDSAGVTTYLTIHDGPITRVAAYRPGGQITVESADPSAYSAAYIFQTDSTLIAGSNAAGYALAMVNGATPGWGGWDNSGLTTKQLNTILPADATTPAGTTYWQDLERVLDMIGAEAFFRPDRIVYYRTIPTISTPVYVLATGPGGTVTGYESTLERAVNEVFLAYSNGVTGIWQDTDPSSPTKIGSTAGHYGLYESRQGTPSVEDANAAAKAYASRVRGTMRTLTVRAVPAPWLEPGDTVTVAPIGQPAEMHLIQSVSIPLGMDVMTVTTRNPVYTGTL